MVMGWQRVLVAVMLAASAAGREQCTMVFTPAHGEMFETLLGSSGATDIRVLHSHVELRVPTVAAAGSNTGGGGDSATTIAAVLFPVACPLSQNSHGNEVDQAKAWQDPDHVYAFALVVGGDDNNNNNSNNNNNLHDPDAALGQFAHGVFTADDPLLPPLDLSQMGQRGSQQQRRRDEANKVCPCDGAECKAAARALERATPCWFFPSQRLRPGGDVGCQTLKANAGRGIHNSSLVRDRALRQMLYPHPDNEAMRAHMGKVVEPDPGDGARSSMFTMHFLEYLTKVRRWWKGTNYVPGEVWVGYHVDNPFKTHVGDWVDHPFAACRNRQRVLESTLYRERLREYHLEMWFDTPRHLLYEVPAVGTNMIMTEAELLACDAAGSRRMLHEHMIDDWPLVREHIAAAVYAALAATGSGHFRGFFGDEGTPNAYADDVLDWERTFSPTSVLGVVGTGEVSVVTSSLDMLPPFSDATTGYNQLHRFMYIQLNTHGAAVGRMHPVFAHVPFATPAEFTLYFTALDAAVQQHHPGAHALHRRVATGGMGSGVRDLQRAPAFQFDHALARRLFVLWDEAVRAVAARLNEPHTKRWLHKRMLDIAAACFHAQGLSSHSD